MKKETNCCMVTIIVPILNEENNIVNFEKNLLELNGEFEVLFSDGGSTDNTLNLITMPYINEKGGRGAQMDRAAEKSRSDYLWFLHADSKVHKDSILEIEMSNSAFGCFRLEFEKTNKFISDALMCIVAFNSHLRVKYRSIVFGDQGIFITRELFEKIGGYKNLPIMEDYDLSMRLKNMGIKPKEIKLPIKTSPRRFIENGIFKTIIKMQKYQYMFRNKKDVDEIDRAYNKKSNEKDRKN